MGAEAVEAPATRLTALRLDELRGWAVLNAGRQVDRGCLDDVMSWLPGKEEWASAVLGRPLGLGGDGGLAWQEVVLLQRARAEEPEPPERPSAVAERVRAAAAQDVAAAHREKQIATWAALRKRLPMVVDVVETGCRHIVTRWPVRLGVINRKAGAWLCGRRGRPRPVSAAPDVTPTCERCLRLAVRLAEVAEGSGGARVRRTGQTVPADVPPLAVTVAALVRRVADLERELAALQAASERRDAGAAGAPRGEEGRQRRL